MDIVGWIVAIVVGVPVGFILANCAADRLVAWLQRGRG